MKPLREDSADLLKANEIKKNYSLAISIHCKQFFPSHLVNNIRCINVHPGYNPYNRGWYPQVFSILNGLKSGVTIHEMDEKLDHGPIIVQKEYKIESWDTSGTAYEKIMKLERELVFEHFLSIRDNKYKAVLPCKEGNINISKDFEKIKCLSLDEHGRFGDFLNRLRALTHGGYKNAYYIDETGKKIYVRIILEPNEK